MWSALEAIGLALIVAFFWFIWPPLVLLAAGLVLCALAYLGERKSELVEPAEEATQ